MHEKHSIQQRETPVACLPNSFNYATILPYRSAGGFVQKCVCLPINCTYGFAGHVYLMFEYQIILASVLI